MELTKKQIADYLAAPNHCPKCGHEHVEGGSWNADCDYASQTICCLNLECEFEWDDVYSLTSIDWADDQDPRDEKTRKRHRIIANSTTK